MQALLRIVRKAWLWLTTAEEAHALYTWILPMIPAGVGGGLAAFAHQQGWIIWLVFIHIYAVFAVARYFLAKYVKENSLSGVITVVPRGIEFHPEKKEYFFGYAIENTLDRVIFFRSKITLKTEGNIYQQDDFEENGHLASKSGMGFVYPHHAIMVSDEWSMKFYVEYGTSPDDMNMVAEGRCESSGPGYDIKELTFTPKYLVA